MKHLNYLLLFLLISLPCLAQKKPVTTPITIGQQVTVDSKILGEKRLVNIYLPEGYNAKDTLRYPVIYLLDGALDEDFIHITGLVQYGSFEWVNFVPKSIVVGITTANRKRDYTYPTTLETQKTAWPETGHSDNFIAYIEKELQPYIDKNYKTTASKTILGQSLGGLLETEILFKKPTLFNRYIIISPSLWWDNGSLLSLQPGVLSAGFTQPTEIYIGVGKEGLTPTVDRVMEVDANLLADKIKAGKSSAVKVIFDYLPAENHATIMHQATLNAFRMLKGL